MKKKPRLPVVDSQCAVCLTSPHHLIKDCIVVRQGPKRSVNSVGKSSRSWELILHLSILQQIERLERTQGMEGTVDILRKILKNMKRREMEMRLQQ